MVDYVEDEVVLHRAVEKEPATEGA